MIRRLTLLSLVLVSTSGVAEPRVAPTLGRLFFTPAERAALDRPSAPAPAPAATDTLRIDGVLRSRSGRSTIWINGNAQQPDERLKVDGSRQLRLIATDTPSRPLYIGENHVWPGGERIDPLPDVQRHGSTAVASEHRVAAP